jgi:hypothetical protein
MHFFKGLCFFIIAITICFCPAYANTETSDIFWRQFRQAVTDNNVNQLLTLTKFPFEVRGVDDSNPIQNLGKKNFKTFFKRLIGQKVLIPANGTIVEKSMQQLIFEKKTLKKEDCLTSEIIRVYQFEFQNTDGQWFFIRAYLEE